MKLQTKYSEMTNEQLCTELKHRFETFGETLGGYQEGGLKITINNNEVFLDNVNDDGSLEFVNNFNSDPGDTCLIIDPEHDIYYLTLIDLLTAQYQIYHIGTFSHEEYQWNQLEDRSCEICRESAKKYQIPGHLEIGAI